MRLGGRVEIDIDGATRVPCEVIGSRGDRALAMPFGNLSGVRRGCAAHVAARRRVGTPLPCLARSRRRCAGAPDRRWSAHCGRRNALSVSVRASCGPYPPAGDGAARSRRAGAQHLHDMLPGPENGHFRRLRRRASPLLLSMLARYTAADVAVIRPCRRARTRGAGISPGRSRTRGDWHAPSLWSPPPTSPPP